MKTKTKQIMPTNKKTNGEVKGKAPQLIITFQKLKNLFFLSIVLFFSLTSVSFAQKGTEGVYLSANDFYSHRISFAHTQIHKKFRLHLHEIFCSSTIKIIADDSVTVLIKDSVFGYCDKNNNSYRFYKNGIYKIMNPLEKILLYSKTSMEGGSKNRHLITNYFFSENANTALHKLSIWNLKLVLVQDACFHKLLDVYFHSDDELIAYNHIARMYQLNSVYNISNNNVISKP